MMNIRILVQQKMKAKRLIRMILMTQVVTAMKKMMKKKMNMKLILRKEQERLLTEVGMIHLMITIITTISMTKLTKMKVKVIITKSALLKSKKDQILQRKSNKQNLKLPTTKRLAVKAKVKVKVKMLNTVMIMENPSLVTMRVIIKVI